MKKKYTETDEIEIRLTHNVAGHYFLEWRYKEPRKFLFFNIKDKWKLMSYYNPGVSSVDDDPNDDIYWYWRGFHMGKSGEVQEYEKIKRDIKTKKQLFDYFNVSANIENYYRDLHEHNKWLKETNENIKKYVK